MSDSIYFWKINQKYGEFSQWFISTFSDGENEYNCCEQYMMFMKAVLFNDLDIAAEILEQKDPKIQKKLGRKVKNFDYRKWNNFKEAIVFTANYYKFNQNNELKDLLLSTQPKHIYESSPYDKIWGIGITKKQALNGIKINGQNLLGIAIMDVRNDINKQ